MVQNLGGEVADGLAPVRDSVRRGPGFVEFAGLGVGAAVLAPRTGAVAAIGFGAVLFGHNVVLVKVGAGFTGWGGHGINSFHTYFRVYNSKSQ